MTIQTQATDRLPSSAGGDRCTAISQPVATLHEAAERYALCKLRWADKAGCAGPSSPDVAALMASEYFDAGSMLVELGPAASRAAVEALSIAASAAPDRVDVRMLLAEALALDGRDEDAILELKRSSNLAAAAGDDASLLVVLCALVDAYLQTGQIEAARETRDTLAFTAPTAPDHEEALAFADRLLHQESPPTAPAAGSDPYRNGEPS